MLDIQLGRRNLSPIQRIAIAEKYRPMYEKEAKENQVNAGGDKKSEEYKKSLTVNLPQAIKNNKERNPTTDKKLADIADVSEKTYRMGAKILNSDNEDLKQRVQSGKTSISAGYKELIGKTSKKKESINNEATTTTQSPLTPKESSKSQKSEETKQIRQIYTGETLCYTCQYTNDKPPPHKGEEL